MRRDVHSSQEHRPMIDFQIGNGLCLGSGIGSGNFFQNPARPGPGEAAPPSAAEHAPTPTHPHTPAHVDAIDFNTPR